MDAGRILELVLAALVVLLFVALIVVLVRSNRKYGFGLLAWARKYSRTVRVACDYEAAHELCHRGLRELFRTRTTEARKRGRFGAWARLHERADRNRLQFDVERDGAGARITVTSRQAAGLWWQVMSGETVRERREQVDRLADWLGEAGAGRVAARS